MTRVARPLTRLGAAAVVGVLVATTHGGVAQALTGRQYNPTSCALATASATPPTPSWHLARLGISQLSQLRDSEGRQLTGEGVSVAVIDTGVASINTKYLKPVNITSLNYLPDDPNNPVFDCAHGTGVMSLIAGYDASSTDLQYVGVAPNVKLYSMRVLGASTENQNQGQNQQESAAAAARLYQAVADAITLKVDVINISITTPITTPQYQALIKRAIDSGIVVVAAAGNIDPQQGFTGPLYPAAYPGVIAVANSTPKDQPAPDSHSSTKEPITIAAPGEQVTTLAPTTAGAQAFTNQRGTSFAAPIVSGVVALMLQRDPQLTPAQVRQRLIETADPPSGAVPDPRMGYGIINPLRTLAGTAVSRSVPPMPSPSFTPDPPRTVVATDPVPARVALAAGAGASGLVLLGLVARLVIPSARKRQFRAGGK